MVGPNDTTGGFRTRFGYFVVSLIKIQVFVVYFQAGVAKGGVDNWANGTEIYYTLLHPMFGANSVVAEMVGPVVSVNLVVQCLTWGTMVAEVFIAFAIFGTPRVRVVAWVIAASLHAGIALVLGIVSFSVAMITVASFALLPFGNYISRERRDNDGSENIRQNV